VSSKVEKLPVGDWVLDGRNDFAAIWDEDISTIIHFHPDDQRVLRQTSDILGHPAVDFGAIGESLVNASIAPDELRQLSAGLDQYADGAYLGMTTLPAPDQFQLGFDQTPFCTVIDALASNMLALGERFPDFASPLPESAVEVLRCSDGKAQDFRRELGWSYEAEDAFSDAGDGELSQSGVAAGEVNEALRTPLSFQSSGEHEVAVAQLVLAAAPSAAALRELLATVDPAGVAAASEAALSSWLADRRVPTGLGAEVETVARRSLINVRVGTDAGSGAVVASIARQPPYYLDWPRDGAFFNLLLDVSGQRELVTRRTELYQSWQRKDAVIRDPLVDAEPPPHPDGRPSIHYPGGAWEMNYLPDGTPGGIFRFEIDTTAFAVWTLVAHVGWLPEKAREEYLRRRWEAIRTGADLIAGWKDEDSGLQAPAQEDDSGAHSQTIHGAVTVLGAIELASRAARLLGEDADAARWEARTRELRGAILEHLYDPDAGRFIMGETARGPFAASGLTPTGPTAWAVWPMTVLPLDDPRTWQQVDYDMGIVAPMIDLEEEGGLYFMKNTNAAAIALLGLDGEAFAAQRAELERLVRKLATHATAGTHHFGEVMVVVEDESGARRPEQRTATPHLWEGTLFYLSAMALEDAGALLRYDDALPATSSVYPADCGCQVGRVGTVSSPLLVLIGLGLFVLRRNRASTSRSRGTPAGPPAPLV
jgi:MYXO-CTERM domain-containing protein